MTNEQLAVRAKCGIDTAENMLLLWQQNKGIIRIIASRYSRYAEFDDLMQEGYLALCRAVDAYDPERGKFNTIAEWYLKACMKRYIENNGRLVRIPSHRSEKIGKYARIRSAYIRETGQEPTDPELCDSLGVSPDVLEEIKRAAAMNQMLHLDAPAQMTAEQDDNLLSDIIPGDVDVEGEVLEQIEREELKNTLWPMVDALPDQEPEVIRSLYVDNMTLKDVSAKIGQTYDCTRRIRDRALKNLRQKKKWLRPFLPEAVEAAAYRGSVASFDRTWTSSTEKAALRLAGQD